ncbi:MAG: sodium-dependent transporter [Filifactoraceae bacterium]
MSDNKNRGNWGSRFGYIMAAAGFSIGLGNIWRFPYLVGTKGGGAFVLVYLIIIALIGLPLFYMEVGLGRKTQLNPVDGMRSLTKKGSPWVIFGWLGVLAAFLILSYYLQIMGWIISYIVKMVSGQLNGLDAAGYTAVFENFTSNPSSLMLFMLIGIVIVGIISSLGLNSGLEKGCSIMMPALFIMLVLLTIRSLTLPGAGEGLKWYLTVDFSKINGSVLLTALGQAFFSIGIASGGGFIYGSYLKKDSNIPVDATMIVGFDTLAALIAGFMIFPAIFALGLEPGSGPSLMFVTMSNLFSKIAFGQIFGTMFFILVFFAALTSALGYLEPIIVTCEEIFKIERKKSIWISLVAIFIAGIPSVLAKGPWKDVTILGKDIFNFVDFLSGDIMMPLGALVLAFFTIFVWKFDNFKNDINNGATIIKIQNYWKPIIMILVPAALLWIFSSGILPLLIR